MSGCGASGALERRVAPVIGTRGRPVMVDASPAQSGTLPGDAGLLTPEPPAGVLTNPLRRHTRRSGAVLDALAAVGDVADRIHRVPASTPRKEQP